MVTWSKINSFSGNTTSPILTSYRPCPVCGGRSWKSVTGIDDYLFIIDSTDEPKVVEVREVQCLDCAAVFRNPCFTPEGFQILFAEAGQSYGSSEGRPREQVDWLQAKGVLSPKATVLDIGCYFGNFLKTLPADCTKLGVEIDATVVAAANKANAGTGIEIVHGAFESFKCPVQPDLITMFHVLEHLANPYGVLLYLREISHDDTYLMIEIPTLEHGRTNDIHGFFSVQHLTHFSRSTLLSLVERAGWTLHAEERMPDYNGNRFVLKRGDTFKPVSQDAADRQELTAYMAHWLGELAKTGERLHALPLKPRVVIWGAGMHTEMMYQRTDFFHLDKSREYIIVDNDPLKHGKTWRGIPIHPTAVVTDMDWSTCSLVISSYGSQDRIAEAAIGLGVPGGVINKLYDRLRTY